MNYVCVYIYMFLYAYCDTWRSSRKWKIQCLKKYNNLIKCRGTTTVQTPGGILVGTMPKKSLGTGSGYGQDFSLLLSSVLKYDMSTSPPAQCGDTHALVVYSLSFINGLVISQDSVKSINIFPSSLERYVEVCRRKGNI